MTDFVVKEMEGSFGGSHEWCLIRQAILTWQDSDVRGRYKQFFSQRIYMKIEFSSQRREMLLFLTTNMVAVTGVTCKVAILYLYLITAPQGWVVQNNCSKLGWDDPGSMRNLNSDMKAYSFLFAYNLSIGCSQKRRENYRRFPQASETTATGSFD